MSAHKGFTLVELMIAISIIAIISAIGMVTFSQSQKLARDSRRKQDLQEIKKALLLYHQDNKRFPTNGGWAFSNAGTAFWITDSSAAFNSSYTNNLAKDPLNTCSNNQPWATSTCYIYGYISSAAGACASTGQYFALVTNLENTSDPERDQIKQYTYCDGTSRITGTGGGSPTLYAVTSQN